MGFATSIILAAAGAVLIWAVNATVSGVNIHTIGWILLIAGAIGFVLSLIFLSETSSWGRGPRSRRVVRDDYEDPNLP